MNRRMLCVSLLILFCYSCKEQNGDLKVNDNKKDVVELEFKDKSYSSNFFNDTLRESKISRALNNGDTLAYISLMEDYFLGGYRDEFLFYAMMMSEKKDYSEAYFDVFTLLDASLQGSLTSTNNLYKKMADYYLIQAYLKGSKSAKSPVEERFGDSFDSLRVVTYMKKLEANLFKEAVKY